MDNKKADCFGLNYCIRQLNNGRSEYLKELFEVYRTLLEKEIIFEGKFLSQFDYKNIVTVGLRLNEFDWVENFIHQNKDRISKEFRNNAFTYNLASFHFYKKEYGRTMELLQNVEFTDVFYNLDSKSMLTKTYYELNETEALLSLIDAFKIFLRRNKLIAENQRLIYQNMLGFVKKLVKVKSGGKKPLSEIRKEMEATKQVADLKWLIEKLEELERVIKKPARF